MQVVQEHFRYALDDRPGPIRVISMCAGQSRDVLDVLADYPRRDEVAVSLVELDVRNVEIARASAARAGLDRVQVLNSDASLSNVYASAVPADIVLACGVFGNVSNDDVRRTIAFLPCLCAPQATVIWTRDREPNADGAHDIRRWFDQNGFNEVAFEAPADATYRVGVYRLVVSPLPFAYDRHLFTFLR